MWTLDPSWRNLAPGCERAVQLEAALRERWSAPIHQAEQRALARARDAHAIRRDATVRQWVLQRAACEQRNVPSRERFAEQRPTGNSAMRRLDSASLRRSPRGSRVGQRDGAPSTSCGGRVGPGFPEPPGARGAGVGRGAGLAGDRPCQTGADASHARQRTSANAGRRDDVAAKHLRVLRTPTRDPGEST